MRIFLFIFAFLCFSFAEQTESIIKIVMPGNCVVVPQHEQWKLTRAMLFDNSGHNLIINKQIFNKEIYNFGDTIRCPYYAAEMELLGKPDDVNYQIQIEKSQQ